MPRNSVKVAGRPPHRKMAREVTEPDYWVLTLMPHSPQKFACPFTARRLDHPPRRALFNHRAAIHKHQRIAGLARESQLVGHDNHGDSGVDEIRMTVSTSPTSSGSSIDVGSSNSIKLGCIASARPAIATRCCWPPESCDGYES